jgi:hypothetical protein
MANSILQETPGEFRVFTVDRGEGKTDTIRVRRANRRELEAADFEQSRVFNQGLVNGLPPRNRLLRKLREADMWEKADDQKLNDLRSDIVRLDTALAVIEKKLETDGKDNEALAAGLAVEKDERLKERAQKFRELNGLRIEIDSMLGHTCDAKADDAHRNFVLACVTEKGELKDGKFKVAARVWEDVDALLSEPDMNLFQRVVYEHMTFSSGLPSEWEKDQAIADEATTETKEAE